MSTQETKSKSVKSPRMQRPRRSVVLEAARRVAERENSLCCIALRDAAGVSLLYSIEATVFTELFSPDPENVELFWMNDDFAYDGGRNHRVIALCLFAEMLRR